MTLPDERYAAVRGTGVFLSELATGRFKRVPREVRDIARSLLRHYPDKFDLMIIGHKAPEVMVEKMDDLHRMVSAYGQEQQQE